MNRLKELRKNKGMTQAELAEFSGLAVSQGMISKHELGTKTISDLSKLHALAQVLGCSVSDIIDPNIKVNSTILIAILRRNAIETISDSKQLKRTQHYLDLLEAEFAESPPGQRDQT